MKTECARRPSPLCEKVAISDCCLPASSGLAFAQSFYRDCIGAVMAADLAYQKSEANYRLCAAVAALATEMPVIGARMKSTAEALAAFGYLEPFHEYGHAWAGLTLLRA